MPFESDDRISAKRHRLTNVETYEVFVEDFDRIESEATNVGTDLQFAIASLSAGITLTAAFIPLTIPDRFVHDGFVLGMYVSYGFGLYFSLRAWRERGRLKRFMAKIRSQQTVPTAPPLGEAGRELKPSELASLPAIEPPKSPKETAQ